MLNEFIDGIVEIVIKLNKTIANYWYTSSGQFNAKQRSIWSINAFGIYNGIWNEKFESNFCHVKKYSVQKYLSELHTLQKI